MDRNLEDPRGPSGERTGTLIKHLSTGHGFDLEATEGETTESEAAPALEETHDDLHHQEEQHGLPTHPHDYEVIELHSGEPTGETFPTDYDALLEIYRRHGPEGGKEYGTRRLIAAD